MVRETKLGIVAFILAFVVLHTILKFNSKPSFESSGKAGQAAVTFQGRTLDGQTIDLASLAKEHKRVVLHFWESWCGPCQLELPEIQRLYSTLQPQGLAMVGIYSASSDESIKQIVKSAGLTFPNIRDDGSITQRFGVEAVPTTVVLDPHLTILRDHPGVDMELGDFLVSELKKASSK